MALDAALARARADLGEVAYAPAWTESNAMSTEQAVANALDESQAHESAGDRVRHFNLHRRSSRREHFGQARPGLAGADSRLGRMNRHAQWVILPVRPDTGRRTLLVSPLRREGSKEGKDISAKRGRVVLLEGPVATELMRSDIPARLAFISTDGLPRVVPVWSEWNGLGIVMGTPWASAKLKNLSRNPNVAMTIDSNSFPWHVLLVWRTDTIKMLDGLPPAFDSLPSHRSRRARRVLRNVRAYRLRAGTPQRADYGHAEPGVRQRLRDQVSTAHCAVSRPLKPTRVALGCRSELGIGRVLGGRRVPLSGLLNEPIRIPACVCTPTRILMPGDRPTIPIYRKPRN
jgi:hypothetical protein